MFGCGEATYRRVNVTGDNTHRVCVKSRVEDNVRTGWRLSRIGWIGCSDPLRGTLCTPGYSAVKMEERVDTATDGRTTVALGMEQRRARNTAMVQ